MTAALFDNRGVNRTYLKRLAQSLLLIAMACTLGCAAHRRPVAGANYIVPRECRSEVRLIDCDRSSPPNCKRIAATYPKGCEQLVASK